MKRKLAHVLVAMAVAGGGAALTAAPASASESGGPVCILNQNTWLRDMPWGTPLLTLGGGRGFRVHSIYGGSDIQTWYYGHGAEAPSRDGWIPAANCNF